ncbi:HHR095Wp [Eremothecium sinecaudum]|uniref:Small ribosomal subunit protein uS9m n=1 Tax=Eremothecium sinecaudum TaxID=45286 RepID=A0A0X8HWN2_9SACH|nr:HHR095Wp [Eremothecium sinecaudum]AMD22864.1 HHR095Wp [Eremothecium sinecaudum]
MFARLLSRPVFQGCRNGMLKLTPSVRSFGGVAEQKRIVPKVPTFYSANPMHEAHMERLDELLRKYVKRYDRRLMAKPDPAKAPKWLTFEEYAQIGGGSRLAPTQYRHLINKLNRLHLIDPELSTDEIFTVLSQYNKNLQKTIKTKVVQELDEEGRAVAVGRRKTSTAKVFLVRGQGDILVNGRSLNNYFVKIKDRDSVMYPLRVLESVGKYNIFATVEGGGITGQADAIAHAVAQALVVFNPLLKTRLHRAGALTRDYRHVERKKPGKKKARKMPTWVKR